MDDLQARLSRHQGEPVPAGSSGTEERSPAEPGRSAVPPSGRPMPVQPEVVVPAPKPAESAATAKDTRIVDVEISPAALAPTSPKGDSPAAGKQANRSATIKTNAASFAGDLKDLLEQLRKQAADRPDSVGAALRLRLAEWSLTGQVPAGQEWSLEDAEKRKVADSVWQVLQVVCKTDGQSQRAGSEEFERALESLGDTLRQVQPLKIPNAALCWSVENFGHYEPLPEPWKFPAGQISMVVLYCELAGFRSEPCSDKPGWHHTLLGERLAILTADGKEFWHYDEPTIEDLCLRARRDFFVTKKLRIPSNLPVGSYVLKVTIRDQLANRVTESNVPFEIAAQ